jgi:amylosucrase
MIFYGDEQGYTNDYSYLNDKTKDYDNRWMHRPLIDWEKNNKVSVKGTIENKIFSLTKKLISIRCKIPVVADKKNIIWINTGNNHIAGFLREWDDERVNFSNQATGISWYTFKQNNMKPVKLYDHWSENNFSIGHDHEHLWLQPYQFLILEPR